MTDNPDIDDICKIISDMSDPQWESIVGYFAGSIPQFSLIQILTDRASARAEKTDNKDVGFELYKIMGKLGLRFDVTKPDRITTTPA